MIISKQGSEFNYNGKKYIIGEPIICTEQSEYRELFGTIMEIRDGEDKETENDTPDIYCSFELPVLPYDVKELEKRFSKLCNETKKAEDIALDEVIMSPEMIESMRLFHENKYSLKIYTVCEDWASNGDSGNSVTLFTDIRDAKRNLAEKLADEMNNGYVLSRRSEENFICESGSDFYECYENGLYCENHYKISIQEETLLMSNETLGSLGHEYIAKCRKQDFISHIMQNDAFENISDKALQKMLETSNISDAVNKELDHNDLYWECYWESISSAAEKLLKKLNHK